MSHSLINRLNRKIKKLKAENRLLRHQVKMNNFPPSTGISDESLQQLIELKKEQK